MGLLENSNYRCEFFDGVNIIIILFDARHSVKIIVLSLISAQPVSLLITILVLNFVKGDPWVVVS